MGWDVAIGPEGPIFVEVNERPDPFLVQSITKVGIRNSLNGE